METYRRYGMQPIQEFIREDGRTIRGFTRKLSTNQAHALLAIAGRCPPSPELREELELVTGKSIEQLFTPESLEAAYVRRNIHRAERV